MYKIGIDVGGTFTDIVVQDHAATLFQGKVPSTPGEESRGVIEALSHMAEKVGMELDDFLRETDVINFGTTVATNAMLQHRGVATAMLTTKGFRDIVELRRGYKEVLFDIRLGPPPDIVSRRWRLPIPERIGADGEIITPVDEAAVMEAIEAIRDGGIRAVSVCFLNSYVNPTNEERVVALFAEHLPEVEVYLSSEVLPKIREFERFSTTNVNAFVSPLLKTYLDDMVATLRERGFRNELLVMQSNGGIAQPEHAGRLGCGALLSGPAGGVAAASRIGEACGQANIIGVDMGGTSYDVSLIRDGKPETRSGTWFSRQYVGLPMLNIHTIGAGGGSIAWVDDGGALRVGPQSAGARPGPACYGFEGDKPTVTDAFLHLGYLNPDFFLGGRMRVHPDRAAKAIENHVATPLGMSVDEAAFSILRILNNNLANGIRYVSVAQGHDPRDFCLMSFGGAGSATIGTQARDLGVRRVLVPRMASVLCAVGELFADLRVTQLHTVSGEFSEIAADDVFAALDGHAEEPLAELSAVSGVQETSVERAAELRYRGQVHELATPMPDDAPKATVETTQARFHELHKLLYAFEMPEKPVDILAVRQDIVGHRSWQMPRHDSASPGVGRSAEKERRRVCFPAGAEFEWLDTAIVDGALIQPGDSLVGPAVIEEADTTVVVLPGDKLTLNEHMVYEIEIGDER